MNNLKSASSNLSLHSFAVRLLPSKSELKFWESRLSLDDQIKICDCCNQCCLTCAFIRWIRQHRRHPETRTMSQLVITLLDIPSWCLCSPVVDWGALGKDTVMVSSNDQPTNISSLILSTILQEFEKGTFWQPVSGIRVKPRVRGLSNDSPCTSSISSPLTYIVYLLQF